MVLTTYLWIQDLGAEGGTLGAPPPFRVRGGACAAIATMAALEEPSILVNSPLKRLGAAVVTPSPVKVPRQAAPDPSPEPRQPSAASPDPRTKSPRDMRYAQRVFRQDAASVQSCLRFDRREAPLVSPAARAPAAASSSRTPTATCAKSPRSSTKKKKQRKKTWKRALKRMLYRLLASFTFIFHNGVYVDTTAVAAAIRGAASTAAGGAWSYLRRLQMPVWANGEASLAPAQQEGHGREGGGQWGPCAEPESADGAALNPHGELCGGRRNW